MPPLYNQSNWPISPYQRAGRQTSVFDEYGANKPQQSISELTNKYLANVPKVNIQSQPEKLYESIMGPARQDVTKATEEIGLGLQKYAGGGSSYEDMLARYLPGAIEPLAKTAAEASTQAQQMGQAGAIAKQQSEIARYNAAKEVATVETQIREESRRFMLDLKAKMQIAERELDAKRAISLSQARSAEHIAQINANAEKERAMIAANAQMEATQFAQTQENYRNTARMQVYDKWFSGQLDLGQKKALLDATEQASKYGVQTPSSPGAGTGTWNFGNRSGTVSPGGITENPDYQYPQGHSLTPSLTGYQPMSGMTNLDEWVQNYLNRR